MTPIRPYTARIRKNRKGGAWYWFCWCGDQGFAWEHSEAMQMLDQHFLLGYHLNHGVSWEEKDPCQATPKRTASGAGGMCSKSTPWGG